MKNTIVFVLLFFAVLSTFAQFKIDAQFRPRLEFRDGYQKLQSSDVNPTILTTQRTRLTLSYETENLKIRITPQDVRIWGDEQLANITAVYGDYASFDMFEGYAEVKVKNDTWLSAGRQQLVYDNEWLLAARNWNQNGNAVDALVLKSKLKTLDIHAGLVWNTNKDNYQNNYFLNDRYKSLNYFWANKKFSAQNQISLTYIASGLNKNDSSDVLYYRHTAGVFAEHKGDKLFASLNGYYQCGVNTNAQKVGAFLGFIDARYLSEKYFIGGTLSYLSGNKYVGTEQTTDNLFDMLYGARHKYFGFLDYFRSFSKDTKQGGIVDYALNINYLPTKKNTLKNSFHYFQLAQTNSLTGNNAELGFENDLILTQKVNDWGELELGYCFFLPGNTLKLIQSVKNNKFSQFAYLQFTVKSTVFKSEKK